MDHRGKGLRLPVERLLLVAERPALGHDGLSALGIALAPQAADIPREHLDAGPQVVPLGADLALAGVGGQQLVDHRRHRLPAPGEPGAYSVGIGTETAKVQHERSR